METTLLVAKVMGVYLVVSGLFLLFRGKSLPLMLKDFFDHPAIVYLTGAILVFISTLYLIGNNVWDGTWRTVVTVFVWLVLLKGVGYILFPEHLQKISNKFIMKGLNIYGVVIIVMGIALLCLF
ncbi:hypothetical protein K9M47_04220 [Candidatus Gracilibacteria bacterium]|nr:hypothetical protein [Candidatus Gracilibacteria bacterium]MCF7898560.1 hypothetical protein [Candidatus Paceibacterota bacterium]